MSEEQSKRGAAGKRPSEASGGGAPTAAERASARAAAREKAREKAQANATEQSPPKKPKPDGKRKAAKSGPTGRPKPKPKPKREAPADGPGAARLFALVAGGILALLGVVGFVYDASWGTGADLASDDVLGTLMVNGWRNVVYLVTGVLALAFAARRPRATALGLGSLYLVYAVWGFIVTERGIGDILGVLPLGDWDNGLHLAIGLLGLLAAFVDGPLPQVPERLRPKLPKPRRKPRRAKKGKPMESGAGGRSRLPRPDFSKNRAKPRPAERTPRSAPGSPRRGRAAPRRDGDDAPR